MNAEGAADAWGTTFVFCGAQEVAVEVSGHVAAAFGGVVAELACEHKRGAFVNANQEPPVLP